MAQGLDMKNWDEQKSPSSSSSSAADTKLRLSAILKRTRSSTGSRRIFPPQFKLKVLDSYRNDLDCRGNQRATARKYNIHRRQIQKWLQCEQNLRSSVEEGGREPEPLKKSGDGKADATLNRSAMIYARLSDAERSRDGNAVRPTLNPETEVYDRRDSSAVKLDAWNLKRVAQKLYPSSHEKEANLVSDRWSPRIVDDGGVLPKLPPSDRNHNRVRPDDDDSEPTPSERRTEILPKECCKTNDKPIEIFTEKEASDGAVDDFGDKLNMAVSDRLAARESVEGQKLCAAHERLVQKYTDGQKLCDGANELLCSRGAESNCLGKSEDEEEEEEQSKVPKMRLLRGPEDSKSFSPKRKWMQESLQDEGERQQRASYSTLPIKQRVKMDLKSAAASGTRVASHNFTIEKLCASDIKTENVSPPSYHSPAESDYYNWRPDTCPVYPGYPLVSHSPLARATLPFPPPLLFSHRVIPDLVSLHFKPDSPDRGSNPGARSCSPDSVDIPLKEEKVSDEEENVDVDVLSTTPVEKKSFDFAGCNFGKRRSFSVQFKLTVLDAFYNDKDCNKNQRATARKFNINRRQVQKWLSQENDLRSEGSIKNGKYLQRQRLGNERDADGEETCKQCPQHCTRKKKETEEMDKTIEVNVKHCTNKECLSRNKSSADGSSTPFSEGFEFCPKGCYQSDLKSANIYDNYLLPENSSMICHNSFLGWPNINSSALPVPNFHYLSPWYHNFDYCQEKSKIY